MADTPTPGGARHVPFVPADRDLPEFTLKALIIGLVMCVVLGAANAYLGLKAGMTIAATYTTAVIGMAVIKSLRGTILEENCARTVGSIGGNVAAGAIFTLPAFFIAGIWRPFFTPGHYVASTIILVTGAILGIMFVTVTRRVLVNNAELPLPESVAREPVISSFSTFCVAACCANARGAAISPIAISVAMTHVFLLKDLADCLFLLIKGSSIDLGFAKRPIQLCRPWQPDCGVPEIIALPPQVDEIINIYRDLDSEMAPLGSS